ncbi:TPA: phage tail protein [Haemophilus influenzae]|uniref:phage tail-collar fiber domain-containing protein n=1 Tax=Haemophilus influenzae TaxID=727 RepID=UPI000766D6D9|nr:phage tail protein [Haemophilus influenzae]CWX27292.1 Probable phage tail-fiber protein [Haemophilus influenzae]CWX49543.1 Probable phage tail-fiber protein [Haemophilus influenzae]
MASQYFAILTDYGTRAIAHALSQGQPLQLTQFAVGDGNGKAVTPTASATALVHQTHIAPVSAVSLDPRNNKQVIVELTIPENIGGFYIREMGVFDAQNKLIAYANCPESFKPAENSGSGKVQVLRMILKVESSSAVTLSIDNSVIFVTRQQMAPKIITATTQNGFDESGHSHEIAKASTTQQGIVQLTNDTGLESESLALTAKAGKKLDQKIAQLHLNVSQNYIENSKKSSAVNSESEDNVATSKAAKTAYDKAVEAKTTADGKVGLSGNEEIAGDKLFRSQTKFQNGVLISANKGHWDNGYKVYIGADSDNAHLVFGDDTLRLHGSNHRISYNNYHLFHEGYKPRFNEHIINKPNTLAGYGIGNFKVEQGQGDANGYKTDGNYYLASGQNLPENGAWHIEVVSGGATNAVRQIARKANDNKIKTRFFNGSNWSEWKETGGDGVPIGAVVSFPRAVTNPVGFLKADGTTFNQQTFPDLYRTLGDSNQLPDLTRSDTGMTAYFAVDNIPAGWIAFDSIRTTVTQQNYPELYRHLVGKYGSIAAVPKAEDRFIRNAGNGLQVGQTQEDEFKRHVHRVPIDYDSWFNHSSQGSKNPYFDYTTFAQSSDLWSTLGYDNADSDNGFVSPKDTSQMATGGNETRPKSLILKLCIKAKNTFDDVQFWVKAFGVVENAGALDAGTLAQNMQALSESVEQKIEENKQYTLREINNAKADINQQFLQAQKNLSQIGTLKKVWEGNVSTGQIEIAEKCFGKTLIFYLRLSEESNYDPNTTELVSFEVGAEDEGGGRLTSIREIVSKYNYRQVVPKQFTVYIAGDGKTITIDQLDARSIKRIDIR